MPRIYHIISPSDWKQAGPGPLERDSLKTEGFIHCSNHEQVARSANKFYAYEAELVVLVIDPAALSSPVRDEGPGIGQTFPHIYGPIDRAAVVGVEPLRRDAHGRWELAEG